jgi:hypothetical protein
MWGIKFLAHKNLKENYESTASISLTSMLSVEEKSSKKAEEAKPEWQNLPSWRWSWVDLQGSSAGFLFGLLFDREDGGDLSSET